MKKLYIYLLLGAPCVFLFCKGPENPPDLIFEFANVGEEEVDVNTPLTLESAIENAPSGRTETADANDRSIRVQYREDENSPWIEAKLVDQNGNETYELVKPVPSLKPGTKDTKKEGFTFSTPGIYRYILEADVYDVVVERQETNNDASSGDGLVRATVYHEYQLTVKVNDPNGLTDPNFKPGSVVRIQYIGEQ